MFKNVMSLLRRASSSATPPVSTVPATGVRTNVRSQQRYLRGDRAGILGMRQAVTRDAKIDVRDAARRASALASDFLQNSGWLSGAAQQILSDTIGDELKLNSRANLSKFGYTSAQAAEWRREVEEAWRQWAWNKNECDLAGKATIAEMVDGVMRSYLVYGEAFGVMDFLSENEQASLGVTTRTKVSLVAPHRCPLTTHQFEGLEQGIFHNSFGRPERYRFRENRDGIDYDKDVPAGDVIHVMDRGENLNSPRGISPFAPGMKVLAQSDQLADATLATALMQTIFAATIKSPEPSEVAFQAIQTLADTEQPAGWEGTAEEWGEHVGTIAADLVDVWGARIGALKEKGISLSDSARINHLGPGEEFEMHTASTPGDQYLPFFKNLLREIARCLGVTFESLSMDHSSATYSSVRMAIASIWPIVLRRRSRIAAPFLQAVYEKWLEEMIVTGRIQFKGGARAFLRDKESVYQAEWSGPAAPTADDYKSALADKIELETGISSYADICAKRGKNAQEQITAIGEEIKEMARNGVPHPFGRTQGGAGPQGAAADGRRDPASAEVV